VEKVHDNYVIIQRLRQKIFLHIWKLEDMTYRCFISKSHLRNSCFRTTLNRRNVKIHMPRV